MKALALVVTALMALGPFVPIASTSSWFLHPPSSAPASQLQSGQGYVERNVLVAKLVPEASASGPTTRLGWVFQSSNSLLSGVLSALGSLGGALWRVFSSTAGTLGGVLSGAWSHNSSSAPPANAVPEPATTLSQQSSSSPGIPPNSTAGYVEYTLSFANNTLFPGNVPSTGMQSGFSPFSATLGQAGTLYVLGGGPNSTLVIEAVDTLTDHVAKSFVVGNSSVYGSCIPTTAAFDPTNGYLYAVSTLNCGFSLNVIVLSTVNGSVVAKIPLQSSFDPAGIAYDASNSEVYVTNSDGYYSNPLVDFVDTASNSLAGSSSLGFNFVSNGCNSQNSGSPYGAHADSPLFYSSGSEMYVPVSYYLCGVAAPAESVFALNDTNAIVGRTPMAYLGDAQQGEVAPSGVVYMEGSGAGFLGSDSNCPCSVPLVTVSPQTNSSSATSISCGSFGESYGMLCLPSGAVYDSATGYLYAGWYYSCYGSGCAQVESNTTAIDSSTNKTAGSLSTGYGRSSILFDQSNGQLYETNGNSGTLSVIFDGRFNATLTESGLPPGDRWGTVIAGALPKYTTSDVITYSAPNGAYRLNVTAGDGYCASPSSRTLVINGSDVSQTIQFTNSGCHTVTFDESGFPAGELWGVTLSGFNSSATAPSTVSFTEPNGNYTYDVMNIGYFGVISYCQSPYGGNVELQGTNVSVPIQYSICGGAGLWTVNVHTNAVFYSDVETVLVNGNVTTSPHVNFTTFATITLTNPFGTVIRSDTVAVNATTGLFQENFTTGGQGWIGGTYTVTAYWPTGPGCTSSFSECSFSQPIYQFGYLPSGPTYQVTFVEGGLPQGTPWTMTFANATKTSTSSTISYSFPDGYYPYTVRDVGPYVPQLPPRTQMVLVNGSGVTEDIGFTYSEQLLLYNGTVYPGPVLTSYGAYNWQVGQLAYDSADGLLYVLTGNAGNTILGVNVTTKHITQEFTVGGSVDTLTVDPLSGDLFVTNSSVLSNTVKSYYLGETVTVIDPVTGAVVAVVPLLQHPSANEFIGEVQSAGFASSTDTYYALAQITNSSDTYYRQVVYAVSGTNGAVESNFTVPISASSMSVDPVHGTVYLGGLFENSTFRGSSILVLKPSPWTVISNATLNLSGLNSISYDSRNGLAYLAFGYYDFGCSGGGLYSFNASTSVSAKVGSMACAASATFNPANGDLYVSNPVFQSPYENAYGMSVVNPATGTMVANITKLAGEQESPVNTITSVNAANGEVYMASSNSYAVSVVGSSNTVASEILLGATPGTMAYSSDGMVFVADQQTSTLWILNATTGQVEGNVPVPTVSIGGMVYDPTNGYLYVVDSRSSVASVRCTPFPGGGGYTCNSLTYDNVTVFNTRTDAVVTMIPVNTTSGSPFEGVNLISAAYDPVSNRIFVTGTNANEGFVFVIDASTNVLVGNISLGAQPSATGAIAYNPVTGYVYALGGEECISTNYYCQAEGSDRLYAINGSTETVVTNSSVPLSDAMAVDSNTGTIYTVGDGFLSFELAAINATTGSVITVTPLPCSSQSGVDTCGTTAAAYDPENGVVYVAVIAGGSPILAFYDTAAKATGVIYDGGPTGSRFGNGLGTAGQQIVIYDPSADELFTSAWYSSGYPLLGAISMIRPLNVSFVPVSSSSLQVSTLLPNGSPVSGVSISVAGLQFITGSTGTLTFTGLPSGASEPVQACIAGLCTTKTVTLAPGGNTISFEVQPVQASVVDPQGRPVGGVQLTYSGTGGIAGLFTTNSSGLAPSILSPSGATFTVSTNLYGTGLPYETPPAESFTVNGTTPVIVLQPLPTGTLQGVVVYSNGTLVASARVTLSEQVNGLTLTDSTSTNSTGGYSATFYAGFVTASALSPLSNSSSPEYATIPPNGVTTLNFTILLIGTGYINLQLYTQYLGGTLQGPLPVDWRVGAHYGIYAQDPQGYQYRIPYFSSLENTIQVTGYSGEQFTVCVHGYEANLPSECVPVTFDIYRNATAVIKLIQPGVLRGAVIDAATGSPVSSWSASVYSLNATGYASFVTGISNYTSSLYYGVPQLGEYRLDVFSYVGSDELWGQVTVNASASQVYQLGNIALYMGAGDLFTGKAGNTLSVIPGESAPGGTLFLRATYNYTGSFALGNVSMLLPAPAGTTAVAGGFLLGGKPVNASPSSSGYYSVPLGDISSGASGEVRYELQIGDGYNGSSLALLALVNYTVGGKGYEEALATATETVEQVTLSAPLSLSTLNTTVSGQAPPGSALDLYSNDTLLGTTAVPAGGYWGLNVTLPSAGSQTTYQLHAVALTTSGVHVYSPSVSVAYDNTEPQLARICMEQTDGRLMCWDPQDGIPHFPYVFVPGMPMTFTITFSLPSLVDDVSVSVPGVGTVNATLDQDGLYRATMVPYAFGDVYINYNVLRIPKGNGATLPFPTAAQILSGLPPGLIEHANYTVLANTTTSFELLINVPSNMSYVFGGTSLEVSATFTPNELYTLTAGDIRNLTETGYPLYNITSSTRVTPNGTSYNASFFVPYSALPPAMVKELDQPMSTCSNCPTMGGEGVSVGQKVVEEVAPKLLEDGKPLGRAIPFVGAFFSAWGWLDDHQWVELQDVKLQQLTSCASSAPGAFASQSQYFINEANKYSATVSGLGHTAEANDVAGGVLSFVPLAGSEVGMISGGASIAYSVGESQLSAKISAAISNCEKDLHSAPPGSDTANVNPIEDPSGVVYAGLLTNPVANATVTVFQFNSTEGQWVPWGASGYGQLNPQQTDPEGRYAWFVPAGRYMVVVQAPGFSTARSIVVYVPPPATGVDINLLPLSSPEVSGVSAFSNSTGSYIGLSFDQLMRASSLNGSTITVSAPGGQTVSGRVVPVAPQTAPDGDPLTSEVVFVPSSPLTAGTNYTVAVSTTVSNYANMTMPAPHTASVSLAVRSYSLSTNALDVGVGEPVNATAVTNDPLAKYVQFTWISPAGALVSSTTAALLSSESSTSITPNSNGTWVVEASFTDGTNVIKTVSRTFYVVEPAALTGVFATATANSSGSASVDDALINGVSVTVTGLAPGIGLSVNSFDYQTVPPGTPSLAGTATYFDLEVSGASTGTATVCFSGAAVTSSYLLYYYSSSTGQWLLASGIAFSPPETVCGTIAASELSGTPMAAVLPPATPPPPPPAFSFSVGVTPATVTGQQGSAVTATVSVSLVSGSAQLVTLSSSGLPNGTSVSFSQGSCTPGCSSTLTIDVSAYVSPGSYTVVVTGSGGGYSESAMLTLIVTPATTTTTTTPTMTTTSTATSTATITSTSATTTSNAVSSANATPTSTTTASTTTSQAAQSTSATSSATTFAGLPLSVNYTLALVAIIIVVLVASAILAVARRKGASAYHVNY